MPQKIGGWLKYTFQPMLGVCRSMFTWVTSTSDNLLALGTNIKVYVETGNNLYDITPLRATYTGSSVGHVTDNCFDVTNGTNVVNVNIQNHGAVTGEYVTFSGVVGPIGGIPQAEFNAEFIITYVDSDNFTITTTTAGTSTATGGGTAISAAFQIAPGNVLTTYG
jgi:hypothetical protein